MGERVMCSWCSNPVERYGVCQQCARRDSDVVEEIAATPTFVYVVSCIHPNDGCYSLHTCGIFTTLHKARECIASLSTRETWYLLTWELDTNKRTEVETNDK